MNPRYAAIFSLQSLKLNKHFRSTPVPVSEKHDTAIEPLELPLQLHQDIERALAPLQIMHISLHSSISWQDGHLTLPCAHLNAGHKKRLWQLIGEQLDKL
ncbi:hypothetical protein [Pseudoalteromonas mariniglutinosa]|uniref:hypothetical protein n=1 Tax=Pseudoalteromonas mariniglutinosa TaxID=206042 RepID=UPI00384D2C58